MTCPVTPLDAEERRHYEELKSSASLSAAGYRAMAAELQRLIKFCAQQEPVVEVCADGRSGKTPRVALSAKLVVGGKLYANQFAGDYLDLIELWKMTRRARAYQKKMNTAGAPALVVVEGVRMDVVSAQLKEMVELLSTVLQRHNVEIPVEEPVHD